MVGSSGMRRGLTSSTGAHRADAAGAVARAVDRTANGHRGPDTMLIFDEQFAYDFSLILMYLLSWTERQGQAPRFWKGFRFEILNQLDEEGFIQDSRRAKSAYLTEAGVRRARELLTRYGWAAADPASGEKDTRTR